MTTFVLVHGAWHGGWCWRDVAAKLRAEGHEVFTPTMTGVGERAHLIGPGVGLNTHIQDIVSVLQVENLTDAVLCGHSYGGMVITGVADREAARIRSLVYLDAFVPENGQGVFDIMPPERRAQLSAGATEKNGAKVLAPVSAANFGVKDAKKAAWVDATCVPHPMLAFEERPVLTGRWKEVARKTYIIAKEYDPSSFQRYRALAKDPAWRFLEAQSHHEVMVDLPEWLADRLKEAA